MLRGLLIAAAGFSATVAAGWFVLPEALYRTAEQPVQFNHAAHTGGDSKMPCQDCHAIQDDGAFAGVPTLSNCVTCHSEAMGQTKAELRFVNEHVKKNREPEWLVHSRQPDNAWFPHAAHVKRGGLKCEACHGNQGSSKVNQPLKVNRISGYSRQVMDTMRMDDCVACHRRHKLTHSCADCHR